MISNFVSLVAVATLTIQPVYAQRAGGSTMQVKAGEVTHLGDSLTVKATQSAQPFAGVKVKGEAVVVVLELDAGKKEVTLFYNVSANSRSSDFYLSNGTQRLAPRALMEDFPSWGRDNDKEIEVLDPGDSDSSSTLTFEGKGFISLLFDVPPALAKASKKLSVNLRTTRPKSEHHSFVVIM